MKEADAAVAVTHHHIDRPPVPHKHPRPDCPFCAIIHDGAPATIVREWADALARFAQDSWADYLAACTDDDAGPSEGS